MGVEASFPGNDVLKHIDQLQNFHLKKNKKCSLLVNFITDWYKTVSGDDLVSGKRQVWQLGEMQFLTAVATPAELGYLKDKTQITSDWDIPWNSRGHSPRIGIFRRMRGEPKPWDMVPDISDTVQINPAGSITWFHHNSGCVSSFSAGL